MPTAKEMFYIANGVSMPAKKRKAKPPNAKQFFIIPCCDECKTKKKSCKK